MADTKHDNNHSSQDRFERTDAGFGQIALWMVVITILVGITAFASWEYLKYAMENVHGDQNKRSPLAVRDKPIQEIQGPVLQINPSAEMTAFAREQAANLEQYAWTAPGSGKIRIPIEQAIDKVVDSGMLKSRAERETTSTVPDDGVSLPQDSSSGRTYWNTQR